MNKPLWRRKVAATAELAINRQRCVSGGAGGAGERRWHGSKWMKQRKIAAAVGRNDVER